MNKSILALFSLLIIALLLFSGCVQPPEKEEVVEDLNKEVLPEEEEEMPPIDLCEGIVCENVCVGTTLYSQECLEGTCVKEAVLEVNSVECGYLAPPEVPEKFKDLSFETNVAFCDFEPYEKYFRLFFTFKNTGTRATKAGATVEFHSAVTDKRLYEIGNNPYEPGKFLFWEKRWNHYHKGTEFVIDTEWQEFDFQVYYCENPHTYDPCNEETGLLLYEGNTGVVCAAEKPIE